MTYEPGDIVEQDSFGGLRLVLVTGREADVKNGRPGFVGTALADDMGVWGYDDQIVTVFRRQAPGLWR